MHHAAVTRNGNKGRYYACAASRNRRGCPFFKWEADWHPESNPKPADPEDTLETAKKLKTPLKVRDKNESFCHTCNVLVSPPDEAAHEGHSVVALSEAERKQPTSFLPPLLNNHKEAQYLFTDPVVEFMVGSLRRLGATSVICIGCPRIHERIIGKEPDMRSLLLDVDTRHQQMYPGDQFCYYNMFNHHFLGGPASLRTYQSFLSDARSGRTALMIDPPFGGLVEPIALTLGRIRAEWRMVQKAGSDKSEMSVFWIFPYFMEQRLLEFLPEFTMLDYKVDYMNHPKFKTTDLTGHSRSPVRIFTNVAANRIPLPEKEGYRFCRKCDRHVAPANLHCDICNICPTKHNVTYVHCDICARCVKRGWSHCDTCQRCSMPKHRCPAASTAAPSEREGCYTCGDVTHKRMDCPTAVPRKKRKRAAKANASQQQAPVHVP